MLLTSHSTSSRYVFPWYVISLLLITSSSVLLLHLSSFSLPSKCFERNNIRPLKLQKNYFIVFPENILGVNTKQAAREDKALVCYDFWRPQQRNWTRTCQKPIISYRKSVIIIYFRSYWKQWTGHYIHAHIILHNSIQAIPPPSPKACQWRITCCRSGNIIRKYNQN